MGDRKAGTPPEGRPVTTDAGLSVGVRFSPHVVLFIATFAAIFYAAQGATVAFVHLWWGKSYRQVEFVMDEWRPNEGYPYVAGHYANSADPPPFHLPGKEIGGQRVLEAAPSVAFEPGRIVKVWFSPEAPMFSYNGEGVNALPVAALPERPGWGRLLVSVALTLVAAVGGFIATFWVGARFARRWQS